MANKTVLDFSEVTDLRNEDVFYVLRGTGTDRDKWIKAYHLSPYSIQISSQADFEYYFGTGSETGTGTTEGGWDYSESGGNVTVTIPIGTSIFLKSDPDGGTVNHYKYNATNFDINAYLLKTKIILQSGVSIIGSDSGSCILALNSNFVRFETTYMDQQSVSGVSTATFTVANGSNFQAGQVVHHSNDQQYYDVLSVSGNDVTVDRSITGAASGNLSICQSDINLRNFTVDGRGGVDGLGGTRNMTSFYLSYCSNSNIDCFVTNSKWTSFEGGAVQLNYSYNVHIEEIANCYSYPGGAIALMNYSKRINIDLIRDCGNTGSGSGILGGGLYSYNCPDSYSKIEKIKDCVCDDGDGGGVYLAASSYFYINEIIDCIADLSGGGALISGSDNITINIVKNCSGSSGGGIFCNGDNLIVNTIENCSCTTNGGGIYFQATYAIINSIINCSAGGNGGGAYLSMSGTSFIDIKNIYGCSAVNGGGVSFTVVGSTNPPVKLGNVISCNASTNGGGIHIASGSSGNVVSIEGSWINTAGGSGNEIYDGSGASASWVFNGVYGTTIKRDTSWQTGNL